jgi:hypothetical protein
MSAYLSHPKLRINERSTLAARLETGEMSVRLGAVSEAYAGISINAKENLS